MIKKLKMTNKKIHDVFVPKIGGTNALCLWSKKVKYIFKKHLGAYLDLLF